MRTTHPKIVQEYINHYNSKSVDAMLDLFTEGAIFESVSGTSGIIRTQGKEELRRLAFMSVEFFEERRQTPVSWVVDGPHVAIEIEYWSKLAKDLPDGKKAGEEVQLRGASFFTIEHGRISRLTDYM